MRKIFIVIIFLYSIPSIILSQGDLPFFEGFDNSTCPEMFEACEGAAPDDWLVSGNWRFGELGEVSEDTIGNPNPGSYFYYSPVYNDYNYRMLSPVISVGNAENVQVFFDMELNMYPYDESIEEDTEGLSIEYRTANGNWIEVIRYEVNVDANVDFNLRTDTYIADVTDSIQLGFRAYGDSSFFISSWEIDNVTVTPLPELTQVSISSTNDLDPTQAISGDTIIVEYTCNTSLIGTNVIIAGDVIPQENISNISGDTWQARYVVQNDDEDGPVSFVTMFKVQYDASGRQVEVNGNPKTTTTDNSLVVIDRTGPSAFELGEVNTFEGLETDTIWYIDDDSLRMIVEIPPDTAIVQFLYESGTSLSFDTDDLITLSNSTIKPTNALTVEAWVKPAETYQNYDGFFSNCDLSGEISNWKGYGWFYVGSGWHFFLRTLNNPPGDATGNEWPVAALQSNVWSHLAATYDGTNIITYRNGIMTEAQPKPASGDIQYADNNNALIGKFIFGSDEGFFDGKIDEVRIWSLARTQTEIQGYMNQPLTGNENGLIGYWRFDEGAGALATDATGLGANGAISSADLWSTNDSPIDFKSDSLAYDKLVGAYVQLTDSTLNNQPLPIGNLTTLTQEDITAGERIVIVTDTEYEETIGSIDSSTHIIGARILDQAGNARSGNNPKIITVDNRGPDIDSAYTFNTGNLRVDFPEGLYQNNDATGAVQKSDFEFVFEQNEDIGGTASALGDSIDEISRFDGSSLQGGESNIQFTFNVDTIASGDETVEIIIPVGKIIFDRYGNRMETPQTTGQINLADGIAPSIDSAKIILSNEYVNVYFAEGVFSSSDPSLDPTHFDDVIFDAGAAGHSSSVSITSITNETGNALEGGESTIRIYLDVVGAPSGTESIIIPPIENAIIDRGENPLSDSTEIIQLNKYPWIITESQHTYLDENNGFVQIVFSDAVYGSPGVALTNNDFNSLNFQQGAGGNATAVNIADIRNTNNNILNTGEDTIRIFLNITGIPSGEESIEIRSLNETSVVNSINNPLATSDTLFFNLEDRLSPLIDSAYINNTNDYIIFMASESLWTNSDHNLPLEVTDLDLILDQNIDLGGNITNVDILALKKIDGTNLVGGEKIIKIELALTNQPASGVEQVFIKVKDGSSIYDRNGNPMDIGEKTDSLTLYDLYKPSIDSLRIINTNEYANLYFSEGVYNSTGGPIDAGDFADLNFQPGDAPGATDVAIDYLRKTDGTILSGGEKQIRVYVTVSGFPSGTESIEIKPQDNSSIKDFSDNYMEITSTGIDFLNSFPRIIDSTLSSENNYIQLIFNEDIYNPLNGPVNRESFSDPIIIQGSGGNIESATISTIRNASNSPLTTGEDTIRLFLSFVNPPASGFETIEIKPLTSNSIFNKDGNALDRTEATRKFLLYDRFRPFIYPEPTLTNDTILIIQTNEGIFTDLNENNQGVGMVLPSDFQLNIYNNDGNADTARITDITSSDGSSLDPGGGDSLILIKFTLFGALPSGVEEIEIHPKDSTSIFDHLGNPMISISDKVLLPDRLPPMIIPETSVIANDNSYIEFSITEGVYGAFEVTNAVEPNDFAVEFIQNGGNATSAEVNYITNENQFPVVGGENILRCYLSFDSSPSGHEKLYLRATNDNSVFDIAGNGMSIVQVTDTVGLSDQLVPTVDSVSIPHGSTISSAVEAPINVIFSEPIQSFNYTVSARHYDYLSYNADTSITEFLITLLPPMASLDTITITIQNLTDNVGLEAVDFRYEYYTPALGDYDISGKIDVHDLAQFISFWQSDSHPSIYGLGPTRGPMPYLVPTLDEEYNLYDGMTFIRMWAWSIENFGLEPLIPPNTGISINWQDFIEEIPPGTISGQVYIKYRPEKGILNLNHTSFGDKNIKLFKKSNDKGEILLEFGMLEPDDIKRKIEIKSLVNAASDATVIYKFFDKSQKNIASGLQKIQLLIPTDYILKQNYPNPFNHRTTISYGVPEKSFVNIDIFDIKGRLVKSLVSHEHEIGFYQQNWNGGNVASGLYFIKLSTGKRILTKKMILLK